MKAYTIQDCEIVEVGDDKLPRMKWTSLCDVCSEPATKIIHINALAFHSLRCEKCAVGPTLAARKDVRVEVIGQ